MPGVLSEATDSNSCTEKFWGYPVKELTIGTVILLIAGART